MGIRGRPKGTYDFIDNINLILIAVGNGGGLREIQRRYNKLASIGEQIKSHNTIKNYIEILEGERKIRKVRYGNYVIYKKNKE